MERNEHNLYHSYRPSGLNYEEETQIIKRLGIKQKQKKCRESIEFYTEEKLQQDGKPLVKKPKKDNKGNN